MEFLERFWHGCGGQCHTDGGSCPIADRLDHDPDQHDPFGHGPRLVAASVGVFLMPLACAIGGGHLAERFVATRGEVELWQAAGMLAGMGAGIVIARFLLNLAQRRSEPVVKNDGGNLDWRSSDGKSG